jgi:5-methyltetrahydropteroyltriglutamate--homocysteine methyltransferase
MSESLPLFPVSVVGSLPRSASVLRALRERQAGRIDAAAFDALADSAVLESIALQEESGVDVLTDGEQRRDNFYSFITSRVAGLRLFTLQELLDFVEDKAAFEKLLQALDVPAFAIKNPVVTGPLSRLRPLARDAFEFTRRHTGRPVKVSQPGPYLLTRSMLV